MKKTKRMLLISLVSLALVGCDGNISSATDKTTEAPSTSQKTEKPETDAPASTAKPSTDTAAPDTSDTGKVTEPTSDSTTEEPGEDEELWGEDIAGLMKKHLGGAILPYVSLGRTMDGTWKRNLGDYGLLTIIGSKFNKDVLDKAETAYKNAAGWTADKTSVNFHATNDDLHLTVDIDSDDYGYLRLVATYDEPFDPSSLTEWGEDVQAAINSELGGHDLPFIYLGLTAPDVEWNNATKTLSIDGGKWTDDYLTLAMTSLTASGAKNVKKTTETYGDVVSADIEFDDGSSFAITLYKSGTTTVFFPHLSVFYKEAYNPVAGASWPSSITSRFASSFDNHALPYLYLGSDSLSSDWNSTTNKLTITGGVFDARMFASAKTALEADGYETHDEMSSADKQKSLIASKTMSDGCTISAILFGNGTMAKLDVYYYSPLTKPEDCTDFGDTVKATMDKYLAGHSADFPYVYLGSNTLDTTYDNYDAALSLTGGVFNGAMMDQFVKDYEKAGFTVIHSSDSVSGRVATATKTLDDKCVLTAHMAASYGKKSAILVLSVVEGYNPPSGDEDVDWSDKIQEAMEIELGGNVLPYFYLGSVAPSMVESANCIELTGGSWSSEIITNMKAALNTMEGFTWTFKDSTDKTEGEGVDEEDNTIFVTLYKNSRGKPYFKATYLKTFVVPENGAWSDDMKTEMTEHFGEVLPYVYLGTEEVEAGWDSGYSIAGGAWDDKIYDLAEEAFKKDGYTLSDSESDGDKGALLTAYKHLSDGRTIRIAVGPDYYSNAELDAYIDDAVTVPSDVTWNASVQTMLDSYLNGHTLPTLYLGETAPSSRKRTYSGVEYLQFSFSSSTWKENYTYNAYQVLKASGYDCTYYSVMDSSNTGAKLVAKHTYEDGATVTVTFKNNYGSYSNLLVAYQDPFTPSAEKEWAPKIKNLMETNFDGHVIPYFYLGSDNVSYAYSRSDHLLQLSGLIWSNQIYDLAEEALRGDKSLTWNIYYDYSFNDNIEGKTLVAVAEEPNTKKHFTLKLYNYTSGSRNSYGTEMPMVEIYYF